MDLRPAPQFSADRLVAGTPCDVVIESAPRGGTLSALRQTRALEYETPDHRPVAREVHFLPGDSFENYTGPDNFAEEYTSSILMNRNAAGIEHLYDKSEPEGYPTHYTRSDPAPSPGPTHLRFRELRDLLRAKQGNNEPPPPRTTNENASDRVGDPNNVMVQPWKRAGFLDRGMSMLNLHIMHFTEQTFSGLVTDVSSWQLLLFFSIVFIVVLCLC